MKEPGGLAAGFTPSRALLERTSQPRRVPVDGPARPGAAAACLRPAAAGAGRRHPLDRARQRRRRACRHAAPAGSDDPAGRGHRRRGPGPPWPGAGVPAGHGGGDRGRPGRAGPGGGAERTATRLMSALRAELVEHRLQPGAGLPGGSGSAELAAGAVQGVDGLETYFARYLPQTVLAVVVPLAVLCWCAAVDLTSALIMAVTLPVMPVFMALIGRSAGARARANFQALVGLSGWFLDVTRGLPTLRAFNRGAVQVAGIREVTEQYRRTTMGTLRLSFLSGVVLDLAATLSTALVAVTLGVRLVGGTMGLRPALTVLLLVPELYAPVRRVGSLFHASADGLAATERILDTLERDPPAAGPVAGGAAAGDRGAASPDPPAAPVRISSVTVRYPGRPGCALDRVDLDLQPGQLVAVVGASGAGKTTLGRVVLGLTRPDEGVVLAGGRPLADIGLDNWRGQVAWAPSTPPWCRGRSPTTSPLAVRTPAPRRSRPPPTGPPPTASSSACPRGTTRRSGPAAGGCRPASANASGWPGRCCETPGCSCSTSRRSTWTRPPPAR